MPGTIRQLKSHRLIVNVVMMMLHTTAWFVTASYSQDGQALSTVWPEYKAIVSAYQAKIQLKVVGGRVLSKK